MPFADSQTVRDGNEHMPDTRGNGRKAASYPCPDRRPSPNLFGVKTAWLAIAYDLFRRKAGDGIRTRDQQLGRL